MPSPVAVGWGVGRRGLLLHTGASFTLLFRGLHCPQQCGVAPLVPVQLPASPVLFMDDG